MNISNLIENLPCIDRYTRRGTTSFIIPHTSLSTAFGENNKYIFWKKMLYYTIMFMHVHMLQIQYVWIVYFSRWSVGLQCFNRYCIWNYLVNMFWNNEQEYRKRYIFCPSHSFIGISDHVSMKKSQGNYLTYLLLALK